jgi:hypothetical protein
MLSQLLLLPLMIASLCFFDRKEREEVEALVKEQCVEAPNRPQVGWLANQNVPAREAIQWARGERMPGFGEARPQTAIVDHSTVEVWIVPRATERLRTVVEMRRGTSRTSSSRHGR